MALSRIEEFEDDAMVEGLDTDYTPKVATFLNHSTGEREEINNIDDYPEEVWRDEMRKEGFGGSDAGIIMGVGSFRSFPELVMDKLGILVEKEKTPGEEMLLEAGKALEPVYRKYLAKILKKQVVVDRHMYCHGLKEYEFMRADLDCLILNDDGSVHAIGELKNFTPFVKDNWESGIIGEGAKLAHEQYYWQGQHYMDVMNIPVLIFFACLGGCEAYSYIITMYRNAKACKILREYEKQAWDMVERMEVPKANLLTDEQYKAIARKHPDVIADLEPWEMEFSYSEDLAKYLQLKEAEKEAKAKFDEVHEMVNAAKAPLALAMGDHEVAVLRDEQGNAYTLKNAARTLTDVDKVALQAKYPDIYNEVVTVKKSDVPVFSVKAGEPKPKKAKK